MRNSHNITITESDTFAADDETTWSLPGAVVGFIAWLLALGFPCLMYGPNTLFFSFIPGPFSSRCCPSPLWRVLPCIRLCRDGCC